MSQAPPVIETEVVNEEPPLGARRAGGSGPPVHPLAAFLLLVVDNLWNLGDWLVLDWIVTIPLSFLSVFVPTFVIQKTLQRNSFFRALAYALLLGVVAAVPTSVTGTPVGLAILAWTGIHRLVGKAPARS
ncbi:MAG: hypothetical protein FJ387_15315 [Verrucomicrobia bacterium]|nr:hypothetical protein [Verrucomicrobiota bacterium]